jgi:hypothetical protein
VVGGPCGHEEGGGEGDGEGADGQPQGVLITEFLNQARDLQHRHVRRLRALGTPGDPPGTM